MANAEQQLRQAAQALRAGRKDEARTILMAVVDEQQHNERAWLYLSAAVDTHSLAKLVKSGLAEKYENHGDRVVLYVSSLAANQAQVFDFKVVSQASAIVVQPAAQAYAYYDPDTAGASRSERIGCTAQDDKLISTTITTTTP